MAEYAIKLYAALEVGPDKPTLRKTPLPIYDVGRGAIERLAIALHGRTFTVSADPALHLEQLAKQVNAFVNALEPKTEITNFVVNESRPVGPIWKDTPNAYLHPYRVTVDPADSGYCVGYEAAAPTRWWQVAFLIVEG